MIECEEYADRTTAERMRRTIRGVPKANNPVLKRGLGGTFSYFELGEPIDVEGLITGSTLPTYMDLARYVFYTATGEEFNEQAVDQKHHFIGESKDHLVYLFYVPDVERLKNMAFKLGDAESLGSVKGKRRLVFAPTKYLDQTYLDQYQIDFAQLPYEIYDLAQ